MLDGAGARGTFYLITNNNDYDQTWPAWRTAAANGHEMASQTASYTNLTTATATRRTAELANSKATIESQVPSQQCLSLSYPFGATDTTVQAAAAAYYISARTMYSDAPNYKPFDFFNLKAVGGYPPGHDVAYMSGLTSTAESKGGWLIFHLNEETDAGSWTAAMLNQYLTSLQTKNVWVGTVGSTVKFIRERDSATLSVVSSNSGQIVLSLTDTMDNTVYDQPLTIRSEVPSAWAYVSVMQGARTQFATPVIEDGRSIVYYDAVPDAGPITLVPAVPSITSLSPSSALAGGSAFTLTVNGGGFISGATVRWNGSDRTTTFVTSAQVQASISAADVTIPGAASVTVRNPDGVTSSASSFTINQILVGSVSVSPTAVRGGVSATGTVTISMAAPPGGAVVALSSDNAAATVPATVTVPSGGTSTTFPVETTPVAGQTIATITATYGGASQAAILTVNPPALSGFTLSPATVMGTSNSGGTVTLSGAAPAEGISVALASGDTAVATVPASVTVTSGNTGAVFTVTTSTVAASTPVSITASYGGTTLPATLTVTPPTAGTLTVSPATVTGGSPSTATVTLAGPAPAGGAVVNLTSNNAAATVPASVTVAQGSTSASFTVNTTAVSTSTAVTLTAAYGGSSPTAILNVAPPALNSVSLNPASVTGSTGSTGTVSLTGPAPAGGVVVSLSSSNTAAATVPASVTVAAGDSSATFTASTSPVSSVTPVTITATNAPASRTAVLSVTPPALNSVGVSPGSVTGGTGSTGTVSLTGPAPAGGIAVQLGTSDATAATVPASVTVPAGATSQTFAVGTSAVAVATSVSITATYGGSTQTALLNVTPAALSAISLNPGSVTGTTSSTGTITLTGPAPAGGIAVSLSSSNTAVATVPGAVTVGAGLTTAIFSVDTLAVSSSTTLTIGATLSGVNRTADLTVTPPGITSMTLNPLSVSGGSSSTGTLTLSAPAPAEGAPVSLTSSNTAAATVPASVSVAGGSTTATFTVTALPVAATTTVTVTATYASSSRTADLTVSPVAISSVVLNPASVTGGTSSSGTVTLAGPAPAGGAAVSLASNNAAAAVPATVNVPAGSATAAFTVTTTPVASQTPVTITAAYAGVNVTTLLTVAPPVLTSVALNPSTVLGSVSSSGTVTLSSPAPTVGIVVTLASGNASVATVPASATVPGGSTTAVFTVATAAVAASTPLNITASFGGVTLSADLTVTPPAPASVVLSPAAVTGGMPSTGTVTLSGPAPAGGAVVTLSSNNAAGAVPASVTVAGGTTGATFTVTTSAVAGTTAVTITAAYAGSSETANLTVNPPVLSLVTLNPSSVMGTVSSAGSVTLNGPAPAGGATVTLASGNTAAATVPASVTVLAGSTTAQFTVTTYAVSAVTNLNIDATFGGVTLPAALTVNPTGTGSLTVSPAAVLGGTSSTGTVTLSGPAPAGGAVVTLSSNNAAAAVPASVTVPAGLTSGAFTVTTSAVASVQSATLTATYGGSSTTAALTVNPPQLSTLSLNPAAVLGTVSSAGTVRLTGPAPAGGVTVALASSNPAAATVPASVTVAAGSTSAGFTVTTFAVAVSTGVTITASYGGANAPAGLTVNPPAVSSVTLNPATVTGGTTSSGTVVLTGVAAAGGAVVALGSTNAAVAGVPVSVTVPGGTTGASFTVTTSAVSSSTAVTISASYGGATGSAVLTVSAPSITVPGAPTGVAATAGYAQARVSFTAPASNGGSPILSYTVTSNPGGLTASGTASPIVVTGLTNGTAYTFTVRATNAAGTGPASAASNSVTPQALAMDVQIWQNQHSSASSVVSPSFTTRGGNELLLAFVSSDGPSTGSVTVNTVTNSGTALSWSLVRRTNTQRGTSEIWRAYATGALTTRVTARFNRTVAASSMTVVSFTGVDTSGSGAGAIGATGSGNGRTGAPTASLVTTRANSWVFGVGNDWDNSIARTIGANQTMVHQDIGSLGNTFWVQRQTGTTPLAGTAVTINCTAPTTDRWNLSIVEIRTP